MRRGEEEEEDAGVERAGLRTREVEEEAVGGCWSKVDEKRAGGKGEMERKMLE